MTHFYILKHTPPTLLANVLPFQPIYEFEIMDADENLLFERNVFLCYLMEIFVTL